MQLNYIAPVKWILRILLPILPGILLYAAWPMSPFSFLIFVAFVPLFWLEQTTRNDSRFFLLLLLNLFTWNISTTWWIWNASPGGAAGAIIANSALMCFPWMCYRYTKKHLGQQAAFLAFIVYWLSWEYIHHNWELSWPWLTLGNVFSTSTGWIQWYEYTGTTGGSLWVLLVNIFLFKGLQKKDPAASVWPSQEKTWLQKLQWKWIALGLGLVVSAIFVSYLLLPKQKDAPIHKENVVVVQPNVEAYTEKFNTDPDILIDRMIALSESQVDEHTRLLVWPETAIPVQVWEHEISSNRYYQKVFGFARQHPQLLLVTGIDSYKLWGEEDPGGMSIRRLKNGVHYEAFNTAFATDSSGRFELYHKSKLVPGVESLPSWLGFMSSIFDDLGGTTGSLGRSKEPLVFSYPGSPYHPAPVICYESIYANYVAEYCRKGADIITVITNDGWWGNTPGYKQHMNMSRLRAIENRKWVARSANTGISCFIDPAGRVYQAKPWDTAASIKMSFPPIKKNSFFTNRGDWLSRLAWPVALALLFWSVVTAYRKKNIKKGRN
jgi:apolipoprotein N-acyltransferase